MLETLSTIETQPYVLKYKNIARLKIINFDTAALKEDGLRFFFVCSKFLYSIRIMSELDLLASRSYKLF